MTHCRILFLLIAGSLWLAALDQPTVAVADAKTEYQQRIKALPEKDIDARLALAEWCESQHMVNERRGLLEQIIKIDPENAKTRELLGYECINKKWLRGDELNKAKGLVKTPDNKWVTPEEFYKPKGYVLRGKKWVSPLQVKQIDRRLKALQDSIKARSDWKSAYEVKTAHFTLKSNTSPYVVKEMATGMDACYDALAKVFGNQHSVQSIPVEVYATENEFLTASAEAKFPVSHGVLGYYWSYTNGGPCGIRSYYNGSVDRTLSTLFHECTHAVVKIACGDDVPTWANEGLAVFFEDVERDGNKLNLETIPFGRLWQLQDQMKQGDISLNNLCRLNGMEQYTVQYYPQGWSLIYFMLYYEKNKYYKKFGDFYGQLATKQQKDPGAMFKQAFGRDPDSFRAEWKPYMIAMEPVTAEQLASAGIAAVEGYMDFDRAEKYVTAALEKAPEKWKVQLAAGKVHLCLARFSADGTSAGNYYAQATKDFAKAKELKKIKDKGISFQDEMLLLDYARACIGSGEDETATDLIETVLADDQLSAPAYTCLALQCVASTDPNIYNLDEAKKQIAIADDMGAGHEAKYVHALICLAEKNQAGALDYLQKAAQDDAFGFGAHFYRFEIARIQSGR